MCLQCRATGLKNCVLKLTNLFDLFYLFVDCSNLFCGETQIEIKSIKIKLES